MERIKGRIMKMAAMGLNSNIPDYIWKTEAGERSLEVEARRRAASYVVKIQEMEENRWPKIFLREEIRGMINTEATEWGKSVLEAWSEVGDGRTAKIIWEEGCNDDIEEQLSKEIWTKAEQEIQQDRGKIERSEYWTYYKEWIPDINGGDYWKNQETDGRIKEIWARLRSGNYAKEGKKGYKNKSCRVFQTEEETLRHIMWTCQKTKERLRKESKEWIEKWGEEKRKVN